jgi:hypothetical protein
MSVPVEKVATAFLEQPSALVTLGAQRDRTVTIHLDSHCPGPAADLAILHHHAFAGLAIRRLDLDAPRLAAERTFDLENHCLSLTYQIV